MINNNLCKISKTCVLISSVGITYSPNLYAEHWQSLGQSERTIALGGASSALAPDLSSFYSNPARSAKLEQSLLGINLRLLDTTNVDLKDSGGNHEVERTNRKSQAAIIPTIAGYYPLNDKWTLGLGFGAPFGITADWENDSGVHRYNMSEQAAFVVDLAPTIAFQATDRLSLGATLNIVAFKHLRLESLIPVNFVNALFGTVAPPGPDAPIVGSLSLSTDDTTSLPVPPFEFDPSFDEIGFSLGALFEVNERWSLGATYRSETSIKYEGDATLSVGGVAQVTAFEVNVDTPAHLQIGSAYEIIKDKAIWSIDLQWTRWSNAEFFGKDPLKVKLETPFIVPTGAGNVAINDLQVNYDAHDTLALRTGLSYKLDDRWELLFGYAYDPSYLDDDAVDILLYSSDRHITTTGFSFKPDGNKKQGWEFNGSLQFIYYEDRVIEAGESKNLGGLSLPSLVDADTLGFSPNTEKFELGGFLWAAGLQASYKF